MYSEKCDLRGRRGIERLERQGPYTVIANKVLYEEGRSSRFTVVNEREAWVDSVHPTPDRAMAAAKTLSQV
jgi:hypothetical protein